MVPPSPPDPQMMAVDVAHPQPPHCTWANHNERAAGYCDGAFTSVQMINSRTSHQRARKSDDRTAQPQRPHIVFFFGDQSPLSRLCCVV